MSEEKTEQPTEKRLQDSRKKGNVAQRKNPQEAALLVLGVVIVASMWPVLAGLCLQVVDVAILGVEDGFDQAISDMAATARAIVTLLAALSIGLGLFVLLLGLMLNKFNFAPESLKPKFEKLNPVNGLKGLFSVATVYNFLRMMVYFTIVSVILYFSISLNMADVLQASRCGPRCLAEMFPGIFLQMVFLILLVLMILAVIDFRIQTMIFIKQNKMTKDEIKREHKGSEGDPQIKGKRKQLAREDAEAPTPKDVTHVVYSSSLLVALIYVEGRVPYVALKAQGTGVARMRAKFRRLGKPCVNLPSIANQFYGMAATGTYMKATSAEGMYKILRAAGEE